MNDTNIFNYSLNNRTSNIDNINDIIYTPEILFELKNKSSVFYFTGFNNEYITIRCPFCGDSKKSPHKAHLGIFKDIPIFKCLRCNKMGRVDRLLSMILDKPIKLKNIIKEEYKELLSFKTNISLSDNILKSNININREETKFGLTDQSLTSKYLYLYKRLNINELPLYLNKTLIDDKTFITNRLKNFFTKLNFTYDDNFIENIYNTHVYFLSDRGSFLIGRKIIDDNSKYRYSVIAENKMLDFISIRNPYKSYEYGSILSNDKINICVTEGIFDMLKAIEIEQFRNTIDLFIISRGKYINKLFLYINIFFNIYKANVHYLLDNTDDVDPIYYKSVSEKNKFMINKSYLWKIHNRKDFGDYLPGDKIERFIFK